MTKKNLELLFQEIDKTKQQTTERFRNIDIKLNFLLVFNVGFLIIIQFLFPRSSTNCLITYLQYTFLVVNLSLNLTSFILLFKGLSMKNVIQYEVKDFDINSMKNNKEEDLLEAFIEKNKEIVNTCENKINIKQLFYKSANIILIINLVVSFIGIIFNLIF